MEAKGINHQSFIIRQSEEEALGTLIVIPREILSIILSFSEEKDSLSLLTINKTFTVISFQVQTSKFVRLVDQLISSIGEEFPLVKEKLLNFSVQIKEEIKSLPSFKLLSFLISKRKELIDILKIMGGYELIGKDQLSYTETQIYVDKFRQESNFQKLIDKLNSDNLITDPEDNGLQILLDSSINPWCFRNVMLFAAAESYLNHIQLLFGMLPEPDPHAQSIEMWNIVSLYLLVKLYAKAEEIANNIPHSYIKEQALKELEEAKLQKQRSSPDIPEFSSELRAVHNLSC